MNRHSIKSLKTAALVCCGIFVALTTNAQTTVTATYNSNGSGTITVPAGATSVNGQATGAGGGGGAAGVVGFRTNWDCYNGVAGIAAGGGGEGYTVSNSFAVGSYSITVGKGGDGGYISNFSIGSGAAACNATYGSTKPSASATAGTTGGTSSIGTVITANGGGGGGSRFTYSNSSTDEGGWTIAGGTGNRNGQNGYWNGNTSTIYNSGRWCDGCGPNTVHGGQGGGATSYNGGQSSGNNANGGWAGSVGTNAGAGGGGGAARSNNQSYYTGAGGRGADGKVVISFILPKPIIESVSATTLCKGTTLSLKVSDATYSSGATYIWYCGATQVQSSTNQTLSVFNVASANAGSYTVKVRYTISYSGLTPTFSGTTSGNTVEITSDGVTVTVNDRPSLSALSEVNVCEGTALSLDGASFVTSNNGSAVTSYVWKLDDETISMPHTLAAADNGKTLKLAVTNGCGTTEASSVIVVNPFTSQIINASICAGANYTENGFNIQNVQENTSTSRETTNAAGCLHTINLNLTVVPVSEVIEAQICAGESYSENGFDASTEGIHTLSGLTNRLGCDSTATLNLTVVPLDTVVTAAICAGDSYHLEGFFDISEDEIVESTTMTAEGYINSLGCAAGTITLNLVVKPDPVVPVSNLNVEKREEEGLLRVFWSANEYAVQYILHVNEGSSEQLLVEETISAPTLSYSIPLEQFNLEENEYTFRVFVNDDCGNTSQPREKKIVPGDALTNLRSAYSSAHHLQAWGQNGELSLQSNVNQTVEIYTAVGMKIKVLTLNAGETSKITLPRGIYLLQSGSKAVKVVL